MDFKLGQLVKVTIVKPIVREGARKTLSRLFLKDQAISGPIAARSANFEDRPKRRGGRIWTKYANKVHPVLVEGVAANLKVTDQVLKDLKSLDGLVQVAAA